MSGALVALRSADELVPGINVGVPDGAVLRVVEGDLRVTVAGTVVRDVEVRGQLIIEADDVLVCRVRVRSASRRRILATGRRGVIVEDSEIDGLSGGGEWGVGDSDLTLRRVWVHHCPDGIRLLHRMVVEECRVEQLVPRGSQHLDALQATSCIGATVRRSVLLGIRADGVLGNAAVQLGPDTGEVRGLLFEGCFFDGGNDTVSVKSPNARYGLSGVVFDRCTWGSQRRYRALVLPRDPSLTLAVACELAEPVKGALQGAAVPLTRW